MKFEDRVLYVLLWAMATILIIFTAFIFFLMFGTAIQELSGMNHYWTGKGDCFDRDWNKINEVTCDVKRSCSENSISLLEKCEWGELK